jgi:hypothetical protein
LTSDPLDLGHNHTLEWTAFTPDRALNPQYNGIPDIDRFGAIIRHPRSDGVGECAGGVVFESYGAILIAAVTPSAAGARWNVESWDPLTISPSVLCTACGDHGFIRAGRWINA